MRWKWAVGSVAMWDNRYAFLCRLFFPSDLLLSSHFKPIFPPVSDACATGYRCTVHRVIPGRYKENRRGIRTTVFGEKREYMIETSIIPDI